MVIDGGEEELPGETALIERAFGVANRQRILTEYFDRAGKVTPANGWQHIYRLLLWINPTISLAHCYESDKCQPHKAWYARSLAFHHWVAEQLGVSALNLREHIDQLFRRALPDLAHIEAEARRGAALRHLERYAPGSVPMPGDDPDLLGIVKDSLGLTSLDPVAGRQLVEQIYTHFARENKRKNLLGRGFEDALAALIGRLPGSESWEIKARQPLGEIPGFLPQSEQLKRSEVDLVLWQPVPHGRRIIVTAKWSVRADRERQFDSDFDDYSRSNAGDPFDYVLITNEFDAARLDAACTRVHGRGHLFSSVVHVQPDGVLVAYGREAEPGQGRRRKAAQLRRHIEEGRLVALTQWLSELTN